MNSRVPTIALMLTYDGERALVCCRADEWITLSPETTIRELVGAIERAETNR